MMTPTQAEGDENRLGFMGGVLGRAKKVLFPDGDSPLDSIEAKATSSSSFSAKPTEGKKTKSRGARRARLAASNSSLANITSQSAGSVGVGPDSLKFGGAGKENKLPKSFSKRGDSKKMDSLAASLENESKAKLKNDKAAASNQSRSRSLGSGVVVHRRTSRSSLQGKDCSLSVCSEQQRNGVKREENAHQTMKSESGQSPQEEMDDSKHEPNKLDADQLNSSSASSLMMNVTTYSIAEIENSFTKSKSNYAKNRRRGRRNHPISSLVQGEATKAESKRTPGLSSLMALPSSTQKTQKCSSLAQKKVARKRISSRHVMKDKALIQGTANAASQQQEIEPADLVNVASLTNEVESLKIGDEQTMKCSTPLTIRHRARPGGITSPPTFLHRFSTLSNSNLFPGRSPMPDSNPNLKKRFDGKKTPDKMIDLAAVKPLEASPLATKMSISPNPYACEVGDSGRDDFTEYYASPDNISKSGVSPRVLVVSSSFISSPNNGGNELSGARSNLFSSGEQETEKPAKSEFEQNSPGSAVITVEAATPRSEQRKVEAKKDPSDTLKVSVRGSSVIEVERAAPMTKKGNKELDEPARCPKKNDSKSKKKTTSKTAETIKAAVRSGTTTKEDAENDGTEPRRSSRQSKPTDRLTVTSWKKKKKSDRKVRFDHSAIIDESVGDLVDDEIEEQTIPSPSPKKPSITKEASDVSEKTNAPPLLEMKKVAKEASSKNAGILQTITEDRTSEGCQWSDEELRTLRNALKEINPTSTLYWQEVAIQVGTKTSSECQIKWQSMVATPKVRKATKKKDANQPSKSDQNHSKSAVLDASMSDSEEEDEDDLFNSSPYREADLDAAHNMIATKFNNLPGLSPCIKQNINSKFQQEESSALKFRRKGYNTYIETLRKDINRVEKKKKTLVPNHILNNTHIHADSGDGENQMTGKLLPDGTIKINMQEESCDMEDMDDIWGGEEDEES